MNKVMGVLITILLAAGMLIAQTNTPTNNTTSNNQTQATTNTGATNPNGTAAQNNGTQANTNAGQNGTAATHNRKLPQTASPLPAIAMLGLVSLTLGAVTLRGKRKKVNHNA